MKKEQTLAVFLDSQDFYELMQAYRYEPLDAAKPFEALKTALQAAIAQPEHPTAAMQIAGGAVWQLIETAPKDGEFFLAIEFGKLLPFVTAWEEGEGWFTFNLSYETLLKTDWKPTHWMPLPPAPE